jgi:hypothetical protein
VGTPLIRQRDSALPTESPLGKETGPLPIETDNVAAFARDLRVLRAKSGLDYPDMAEKSHYTMRTLASAAGGLRLPTLPVLMAYVQACEGDISEWEDRWAKLVKSRKGAAELPAAGEDPAGKSPVAEHGPGERSDPASPPSPASPAKPLGEEPADPPHSSEVYVITSAPARDAHW